MGLRQVQLSSVNGGNMTTTDGEELINASNIHWGIGDTVWTDGQYVYGQQGFHGAPLLPAYLSGIPYFAWCTNGDTDLKQSNAAGKISKIIKEAHLKDRSILAAGKKTWIIIGTQISTSVGKAKAISLAGDEFEINENPNSTILLDVNVDHEGNLLMLFDGNDESGLRRRIYATKNGKEYWSKTGDSILMGRITESGYVQYVLTKSEAKTVDCKMHDVDAFPAQKIAPLIVKANEPSNITSGFYLDGGDPEATVYTDDDGNHKFFVTYFIREGVYSTFYEMIEHFDDSMCESHYVGYGRNTRVVYDYDNPYEYTGKFYRKISASDIKQVDTTYVNTIQTISHDGLLYTKKETIHEKKIVCMKKDYDVTLESVKTPDGDIANTLVIYYIGDDRNPDEQNQMVMGRWVSDVSDVPLVTRDTSENVVTNYKMQIGETDTGMPINVNVSCPNPLISAGSFTVNGEKIEVNFVRTVATKVKGNEFMLTEKGLYRNGGLIDKTASIYDNGYLKYMRNTNRLKRLKHVME